MAHWHITDAQSWPLEIPALPELSTAGAYAPGLTYTPDEVAAIMQYGNSLGIETAIEIDMPGHTSSIWFSHPELITSFNTQPYDTNCAEPPCGSLKLNSSAVYSFLDKMFDDLFPRISKYSSYFHSGGDEVNVNAYLLDDTVKSNDTAILQPLMQTFIDHVHGKIRNNGLTPIVWEEMLLEWNLTMGNDVLVNCWLSDESVAQTVAKGHRAIVGNYNNWVSKSRGAHQAHQANSSIVSRLRPRSMARFLPECIG
ncbi:Glucosamine-6-phosphate isomerase (Glucosamine-6-phosphate deaminase) (GNPDA) (GlcN6P deaminase) [Knufia obscura]|uniref:beta-N-acetylhexosaminidase n=1 Tax=Knufia obscura TaxID=1635080 RepID=A0ABR0S5L2_9EURO|nr:Glucosamine-6-phosphate isomerase (Glucosamine-6-phosphate deaminase) (GNPDA) (GlcN6P deaminase) [Knufia obscura]